MIGDEFEMDWWVGAKVLWGKGGLPVKHRGARGAPQDDVKNKGEGKGRARSWGWKLYCRCERRESPPHDAGQATRAEVKARLPGFLPDAEDGVASCATGCVIGAGEPPHQTGLGVG